MPSMLFSCCYCLAFLLLLPVVGSAQDKNALNNNILGSAFLISKDGHLLTCAHCLKSTNSSNKDGIIESIKVVYQNREHTARVLMSDKGRDFALLQLDTRVQHALPISLEEPPQGSEVRAFGYPLAMLLGGGIKVTRGSIAGAVSMTNVRWLQIDAIINPGNSGGALVNEYGAIVGITNAILKPEFGQMGFAVPVQEFRAMLDKHKVPYQISRQPTRLEGPDLVRQVAPAVLPILGRTQAGRDRNGARQPQGDMPNFLMSLHLKENKSDGMIDVRGTAGKFPTETINFGRMVRDVESEGTMLIGFKVFTRQIGNHTYISGLQPIYRKNDREKYGKQYGSCLVASQVLTARSNYAVGGIRGSSATLDKTNLLFIDGLQLVYMKINGNQLDPSDSYQSPAASNSGGIPREFFSSEGMIPLGVHGIINDQDDLASIGLVVKK